MRPNIFSELRNKQPCNDCFHFICDEVNHVLPDYFLMSCYSGCMWLLTLIPEAWILLRLRNAWRTLNSEFQLKCFRSKTCQPTLIHNSNCKQRRNVNILFQRNTFSIWNRKKLAFPIWCIFTIQHGPARKSPSTFNFLNTAARMAAPASAGLNIFWSGSQELQYNSEKMDRSFAVAKKSQKYHFRWKNSPEQLKDNRFSWEVCSKSQLAEILSAFFFFPWDMQTGIVVRVQIVQVKKDQMRR